MHSQLCIMNYALILTACKINTFFLYCKILTPKYQKPQFDTLLNFMLKKWQKWFFNLQKSGKFWTEVTRARKYRMREHEWLTRWTSECLTVYPSKQNNRTEKPATNFRVKDLLLPPNRPTTRVFRTIADTLKDLLLPPEIDFLTPEKQIFCSVFPFSSIRATLDFIF